MRDRYRSDHAMLLDKKCGESVAPASCKSGSQDQCQGLAVIIFFSDNLFLHSLIETVNFMNILKIMLLGISNIFSLVKAP
jgi:hypothetical protein